MADENDIKANTAKSIAYLTKNEKEVIYYINLLRINPALFAQTYLKTYLDSTNTAPSDNILSLQQDLANTKPMPVLKPQFDLFEEAKKHAIDMGKAGKIGHVSSLGETYELRTLGLTKRYQIVRENCQYGYNNALAIVIDLLIDEGIPELSHRKALLNDHLLFIGTAIRPHRIYNYNCVMELAENFLK